MEKDVIISLKNGAELPKFNSDGTTFDLIITKFLKVFKGKKETDADKINTNGKKGAFALRPFERVLVGTDVHIALPKGKVLQLKSRPTMVLKNGITVMDTLMAHQNPKEIQFVLHNSTQFLIYLNVGDRAAQGIFTDTTEVEFKREE